MRSLQGQRPISLLGFYTQNFGFGAAYGIAPDHRPVEDRNTVGRDRFDTKIEGAGLACLFHPCFDQAEIFVEDRVLQVDAQRQDAVQPPLDRGQGLGEPPALPGQVQTGERLELIEVDRLEFCLEQQAKPLVERFPREVGLQIVAGVEKSLPAGLALATGQRAPAVEARSEEHTSELQSLMRTSSAVFCLKKKT